jgi:8-oxo-dGTP diphosphatase
MTRELLRFLDPPKSIKLLLMRLTQNTFLVGTLGVVLNEKKEILLFKNTYNNPEWGLPGGYLKTGEIPEAGLLREIEEESGFKIKIDELITILSDKDNARITLFYLAEIVSGNFKTSYEISDHKFFSQYDLPKIPTDHLSVVTKLDKYLTKK